MYEIQLKSSVYMAVLEIPISTSMTYIFVSRLYSLILQQAVYHYDGSIDSKASMSQRTASISVLENKKYQNMLRVTVKIAILALVSLTSSSIVMGIGVASTLSKGGGPIVDPLIQKIQDIYLQIDTMISCFV